MEDLTCNNKKWNLKPEYHHLKEDWYYWEKCAYSLFKENEFEKVGSIPIIQQMVGLCKNILENVMRYVKEERLEVRWKKELDHHKMLYDELESIRRDLLNVIKTKQLKDLVTIGDKLIDI